MNTIPLTVALSLFLAAPAAGPDPLRPFLDRFRQIKTLEARFIQEVQSSLGQESASGQLWMKRPYQMRWDYQEPEKKQFYLNERQYLFYLPAENQVVVQRLDREEIDNSPLAFLLGGRQDMESIYRIEPLPGPSDAPSYQLTVRKEGSLFPRVILTLGGEPLFITELKLFEENGTIHRYRLSNVRIDPPVPDRIFQFRPPAGVEVIRQE